MFEAGKKYKNRYLDNIYTCLYKEPKKGKLWVNIYPEFRMSLGHSSKERADKYAEPNRIACVEIDWIEGQRL